MSGIVRQAVTIMTGVFGRRDAVSVEALASGSNTQNWAAFYRFCRMAYYNNNLYQDLDIGVPRNGADDETVGLRNPTNAVVSFYEAVVWPGSWADAFPVVLPDDNAVAASIADGLDRIVRDSNLEVNKDIIVQWSAMLGDVFLKVATNGPDPLTNRPTRVWLEIIEPDYVSEETYDQRGFLTHIRLDTLESTTRSGQTSRTWRTEIWDKRLGTGRYWESQQQDRPTTDTLERQTPGIVVNLMSDLGIDFLPWQRLTHKVTGRGRGEPAFVHAWDKIREVDRMATSLHSRLYRHNKPDWALESVGQTVDGLLMPPPQIVIDDPRDHARHGSHRNPTLVNIEGEKYSVPPQGYRLTSLVPNIDYGAQRETISDHWVALRDTDLPELNFQLLSSESVGDLSGVAILRKLRPALTKAERVRRLADAAMLRALDMALTIMSNLGIIAQLPAYGDPRRVIMVGPRPFIPLTEQDRLELEQVRATIFTTLTANQNVDPLAAALIAGYSEIVAGQLVNGTPDVPAIVDQ